MTVPPRRVLRLLDVGEVKPRRGKQPGAAHRPVQARVRRADQLVAGDQLQGGPGAIEGIAGVQRRADAGPRSARHQARREPEPATAALLDLLGVRRGLGGRRRRLRGGVEQGGPDVDRGDAVDEAVVRLGDQCPAPILEPVEERHLPERAVAVEAMGPEVSEPLVKLGLSARRRQRRVIEVGRGVVPLRRLPGQPPERARVRVRELLGEARHQRRPLPQVFAELGDVRRPAAGKRVEDEGPADVHVGGLVRLLELEEHRVQHAELLRHRDQPNAGEARWNRGKPEALRAVSRRQHPEVLDRRPAAQSGRADRAHAQHVAAVRHPVAQG